MPITDGAAPDVSSPDACASKAWYPDADKDGFGDALAQPQMFCTQPPGSVANNQDCGDGDARMHPGATMPQRGPATGKVNGSAFDYDCDGNAELVDQKPVGQCASIGMGNCNHTPGWQMPVMGPLMISSCSVQYPWVASCVPGTCAETPEMRYPECL